MTTAKGLSVHSSHVLLDRKWKHWVNGCVHDSENLDPSQMLSVLKVGQSQRSVSSFFFFFFLASPVLLNSAWSFLKRNLIDHSFPKDWSFLPWLRRAFFLSFICLAVKKQRWHKKNISLLLLKLVMGSAVMGNVFRWNTRRKIANQKKKKKAKTTARTRKSDFSQTSRHLSFCVFVQYKKQKTFECCFFCFFQVFVFCKLLPPPPFKIGRSGWLRRKQV